MYNGWVNMAIQRHHLRVKWLRMESVDPSNNEMCWQPSEQTTRRTHFVLTHNGHERNTSNYWNFLKLQGWPCSEFGSELSGVEPSSSWFVRDVSTGSEQSRDSTPVALSLPGEWVCETQPVQSIFGGLAPDAPPGCHTCAGDISPEACYTP